MAVVTIPQLSLTQSGQLALQEKPAQQAVIKAAQAALPASAAVVVGPTGQPEIARVSGVPARMGAWVTYAAIGLGVVAAGLVAYRMLKS